VWLLEDTAPPAAAACVAAGAGEVARVACFDPVEAGVVTSCGMRKWMRFLISRSGGRGSGERDSGTLLLLLLLLLLVAVELNLEDVSADAAAV
jgi:hypothetical protein